MCDLVCPRVWRLCDGSGWKSTYRFSLDRYERAAIRVAHGDGAHAIADRLRIMNAERVRTKGREMSDDHVVQEAVRLAR